MSSSKTLAPGRQLTRKQELFVDAYIESYSLAAAARKAGMSDGHARALINTPRIRQAILARRRQLLDEAKLSTLDVIQQVARMAFVDPRRIIGPDGNLVPFHELPDDVAFAIQSVEADVTMEEVETPDGIEYRPHTTYKVKFADRNSAADKLMRHLGLYEKDNRQRNPLSDLLEMVAERNRSLPVRELDAEAIEVKPLAAPSQPSAALPDDQVARLA